MDFKNRHPLNAIDGYENLSMLEVLIPFVEPSLKLPLALFIKFSEIRLIIRCFRSLDNLTRFGLHNNSSDPMDMICALTGMSPDLLKTIFSMMDGKNNMFSDLFHTSDDSYGSSNSFDTDNLNTMMNMFQNMQSQTSTKTSENMNQNNNSPTHDFSNDYTNDFEQNIQKILAQYDLEQAADYHTESDPQAYTNPTEYSNFSPNQKD